MATTAETAEYKKGPGNAMPSGPHASYTPVGGPTPTQTTTAYGKSGGKANAQGTVPSMVVGGSCEQVAVPAIPAVLRVGTDKNVSTPVSG